MSSSLPVVVITHRVHPEVIELLRASCTVIANDSSESWPPEQLLVHARQAEGLMVFMPDSIDETFLSQCPRLKVIAAALKGYDNFDVAACTRRGVWFAIAPDLLTLPTAELALGLALGITRNIAAGDRLVHSGKFQGWRPILYGSGLHGRVIGIVGMGKLGRAFARLVAGFRTRVIYADPQALAPEDEATLGLTRVALSRLLANSDIVVTLAPLVDSTFHMIDAAALRRMKPGSYLVNVGRGSVVDEEAVADALDAGHLAGYAADVFEMEDWARADRPRQVSPRLLAHVDCTLFTPHLGSGVDSVRLEIELAAARSILQALRGERPADAIN